jgi:hypothetical protein
MAAFLVLSLYRYLIDLEETRVFILIFVPDYFTYGAMFSLQMAQG